MSFAHTADFVDGPYRSEVLEGLRHWVPDLAAGCFDQLLPEHLGGRAGPGAALRSGPPRAGGSRGVLTDRLE